MAKKKFPRSQAIAVARELCAALKPVTDRLVVAGSLRRRKAEVGDVELVYIPLLVSSPDPHDLFGRRIIANAVDRLLDEMLRSGRLQKRPKENGSFTWGDENKLAVHTASGIPVDFFQASQNNWLTLLVCRTGSAASNERICNAAIARGLRWNPYRGFEDRLTGQLVFIPRSEQAVFDRVGLPFQQPWERI